MGGSAHRTQGPAEVQEHREGTWAQAGGDGGAGIVCGLTWGLHETPAGCEPVPGGGVMHGAGQKQRWGLGSPRGQWGHGASTLAPEPKDQAQPCASEVGWERLAWILGEHWPASAHQVLGLGGLCLALSLMCVGGPWMSSPGWHSTLGVNNTGTTLCTRAMPTPHACTDVLARCAH